MKKFIVKAREGRERKKSKLKVELVAKRTYGRERAEKGKI